MRSELSIVSFRLAFVLISIVEMCVSGCGGGTTDNNSGGIGSGGNGGGGNGNGGGVITGTPLLDQYKKEMRDINGQFKMGRTEVTVGMWREYCKHTGIRMPSEPSYGWNEQHPIGSVSWNECQAYGKWASLRLPSESEWELAASGGDGRNYPWGGYGDERPDYYWPGWDPSKCVNDYYERSGPEIVGSIPAGDSPFGCSDMSGNAWEWNASIFDGNEGNYRFQVRGGSWFGGNPQSFFNQSVFRCNYKHGIQPDYTAGNIGFRLASD